MPGRTWLSTVGQKEAHWSVLDDAWWNCSQHRFVGKSNNEFDALADMASLVIVQERFSAHILLAHGLCPWKSETLIAPLERWAGLTTTTARPMTGA